MKPSGRNFAERQAFFNRLGHLIRGIVVLVVMEMIVVLIVILILGKSEYIVNSVDTAGRRIRFFVL